MMINVNEILKEYFQSTLGTMNGDDIDFSFVVPTKKFSESVERDTVNIYFMDVKENTQLRTSTYDRAYVNGDVTESVPPVMLDMYYILSTYSHTNDIEQEHLLFGSILAGLYEFSYAFKDHLSAATQLDAQKISLEVFPQQYINEHLGLQLWSAIDQNARPLICLRVTAPLEIVHTLSTKKVISKTLNYETLDKRLYKLQGQVVTVLSDIPQNVIPVEATIKLMKEGEVKPVQSVTCDAFGIFYLNQIKSETSILDVSAEGYKTKRVSLENMVELSSNKLTIVLEKI